jgi:ATP-dependent RNA helicase DOB1
MMEVVLQWCKGAKFSEICKLTDVFEGSIIRCFRRLQELLRQMGMAAAAIGNTELEEKFAKSLEMLERPNTVVFNPSYVSIDLLWECMLTCLDCICRSFCNTT